MKTGSGRSNGFFRRLPSISCGQRQPSSVRPRSRPTCRTHASTARAHHQKISQAICPYPLHKLFGQQVLVFLCSLLLCCIPIIRRRCFDHQNQRRLIPPHSRRHFFDGSAHRRTGRKNTIIPAEILLTKLAVFRHNDQLPHRQERRVRKPVAFAVKT